MDPDTASTFTVTDGSEHHLRILEPTGPVLIVSADKNGDLLVRIPKDVKASDLVMMLVKAMGVGATL